MMDAESEALARGSVQQALVRSPHAIGAALTDFGWTDLVVGDEAFAFTTLFEEQGYLAVGTDALDVVTTAGLGIEGPASVIWPRVVPGREPSRQRKELSVDGVALRSICAADRTVLVPGSGALQVLDISSIDEAPLGGMADGTGWMRVRVSGTSRRAHGSWAEIERRSCLAIASELVGLARRIIDVARHHVTTRRQFGRPIGAYQAVRHRVAEAYADMAGAKALVAAAWEDGSRSSAAIARAVAGIAHDAVAKHAIQACGAIGLSDEHELPRLVRRGLALDALLAAAPPEHERLGHALLERAALEPVGRF
jgi:hypothetical protein